MNKKTAIIVGALLLLGGGAYVIIKKRKENGLGGGSIDDNRNPTDSGSPLAGKPDMTKELTEGKETPVVKLGDPIDSGSPKPTPTSNARNTPMSLKAKEEADKLKKEILEREAYAQKLKEEYARKLAENNITSSRSVSTSGGTNCYKSSLGEECCYLPSGDVSCESISSERASQTMRAFSDFDGDNIDDQILEID